MINLNITNAEAIELESILGMIKTVQLLPESTKNEMLAYWSKSQTLKDVHQKLTTELNSQITK